MAARRGRAFRSRGSPNTGRMRSALELHFLHLERMDQRHEGRLDAHARPATARASRSCTICSSASRRSPGWRSRSSAASSSSTSPEDAGDFQSSIWKSADGVESRTTRKLTLSTLSMRYSRRTFVDAAPERRVVITGLGPITCMRHRRGCVLGEHPRRAQRHHAGSRASTRASSRRTAAAKFATGIRRAFFPPHRLKRLDRYAQFSVASALLALEDAKLPWTQGDVRHARVGVSFGTALGGIANAESEHQRFLKKGARGVNPDARAAGLRRQRALEHRHRVRLPRPRHDELEFLRQRRDRGRRSDALHPRRHGRCDDRRRRRSPAQSRSPSARSTSSRR